MNISSDEFGKLGDYWRKANNLLRDLTIIKQLSPRDCSRMIIPQLSIFRIAASSQVDTLLTANL